MTTIRKRGLQTFVTRLKTLLEECPLGDDATKPEYTPFSHLYAAAHELSLVAQREKWDVDERGSK